MLQSGGEQTEWQIENNVAAPADTAENRVATGYARMSKQRTTHWKRNTVTDRTAMNGRADDERTGSN